MTPLAEMPQLAVDQTAAALRDQASPEGGRLDLRRACEARRVWVQREELCTGDRRRTAMLIPCEHGFRVLVDAPLWERAQSSDVGRRRMRFVVAHELGHTFFYVDGAPPSRLTAPDRSEEDFCHRFASALLVPRAAALQAALEPQGLYALSHHYDVSLRVAAKTIAFARPELTLLWLRYAAHPHRGGEQTMRVQWGVGQRFIAYGESLKSELATLAPGGFGETVEALRLSGRTELSKIAAWRFGSSMLAIIRPAQEPSAEHWRAQRTLF